MIDAIWRKKATKFTKRRNNEDGAEERATANQRDRPRASISRDCQHVSGRRFPCHRMSRLNRFWPTAVRERFGPPSLRVCIFTEPHSCFELEPDLSSYNIDIFAVLLEDPSRVVVARLSFPLSFPWCSSPSTLRWKSVLRTPDAVDYRPSFQTSIHPSSISQI